MGCFMCVFFSICFACVLLDSYLSDGFDTSPIFEKLVSPSGQNISRRGCFSQREVDMQTLEAGKNILFSIWISHV